MDIDPVILKIAKEHFGLKQNKRLKVTIADGIKFIQTASLQGELVFRSTRVMLLSDF